MEYFNELGRRVPTEMVRVYSKKPSLYYVLKQPTINYPKQLDNIKKYGLIDNNLISDDFENKSKALLDKIALNNNYKNLLNGVKLPFVYENLNKCGDLGKELELNLLPAIEKSFTQRYKNSKFKAVLQNKSALESKIKLDSRSRYEKFEDYSQKGGVVGWYFPQALQEFDIESQRSQMLDLPKSDEFEICLSGGKEICITVVGYPELLINEDAYSPILCMSSYVHEDKRMVLVLKSYGPHMEFWSMSQMLTNKITQVSEQWTGGISIFKPL